MTPPPTPPPLPARGGPAPAYGVTTSPAYGAPPPVGVIGYATPLPPQPMAAYAWREDALLVVPAQVSLPQRCVKCNADVAADPQSRRIRQNLAWHHPALFFLILLGVLVYAIVALCVQQKATVELSLCHLHAAVRRRWLVFGWGSVILGTLVIIAGCAGGMGYARHNDLWPLWVCLGGVLVMVVGGIIGMVLSRVVTPKRMERGYAWLKGADAGFLQMFPDARAAGGAGGSA